MYCDNECSMHMHKHAKVHPLSKTCASKTNLQFTDASYYVLLWIGTIVANKLL